MYPTVEKLAQFLKAHPEYDNLSHDELVIELNKVNRPGDVPTSEIDAYLSDNFLYFFVDETYQDKENTPVPLRAILYEILNFRSAKWSMIILSSYIKLMETLDMFPAWLTDTHKDFLRNLSNNRQSVAQENGLGYIGLQEVLFARNLNGEK